MSDRISAAQLAETERIAFVNGDKYVASLCAEIRAAWGEAEAATRALRDLVQACDDGLDPLTMAHAYVAEELEAARALVGSENRPFEVES